jgi:hypothetical protein
MTQGERHPPEAAAQTRIATFYIVLSRKDFQIPKKLSIPVLPN